MINKTEAKVFFDGAVAVIIVVAVLTLVSVCTGCGTACLTERKIVDALGVGMDAADELVGAQGGDEYELASAIARGAQSLGASAVAGCETLHHRGELGWSYWLMMAAEAAIGVVGIIEGHGTEDIEGGAPIELLRALEMIECEISGGCT